MLAVHDCGVLLAHLVHASLLNDLALRVIELVDSCRRAATGDESVAIRHGHRCRVVHKVERRVLRLDHIVAGQTLAGRLRARRMNGRVCDRLDLPLHLVYVKHHHLVRVPEEGDLFVLHEIFVVVDGDKLLNIFLDVGEAIKTELNGRVADLSLL